MFTNSLDNKPIFEKANGEFIKDLSQSMIDMNKTVDLPCSPYRVPKDYVMRPDLISQAVYNSTDYTEIILKFNGISNPFSINEGDIILIPNLDSANEKMKKPNTVSNDVAMNNLRNSYKYIDPLKIPRKSAELLSFDNRQLINTNIQVLPPNIAEENISQVTRKNGRVYFGESVATCVKNGISAGEYLSIAMQSKNI